MAEPQKNKEKTQISIIFLVAIALLIAFFAVKKTSPTFSISLKNIFTPSKGVELKLPEIRNGIFSFATNQFFEERDGQLNIWAIHQCTGQGNCKNLIEATNATYSWSMLFLAQAVNEYKTTDPEIFDLANKLLAKVFEKWVYSADGNSEIYNLHQIYEAGSLLENEVFLTWVRDRYDLLKNNAKNFTDPKKRNKPQINSFLISTLSRELSLSLLAWIKYSEKNNIDLPLQTLETSTLVRQLDQIALVGAIDGLDDGYPPLFKNNGVVYPQMACYQNWAKTANLKLNEYSILNIGIKSSFTVDEVNDFFKSLSQALLKDEVNFTSLQTFLPCLHSLIEFKEVLEFQKNSCEISKNCESQKNTTLLTPQEILNLFRSLMSIVIKIRDGSETSCSNDLGFFSDLSINKDKFSCNSPKVLADNSWLSYILGKANYDSQFSFEGIEND